MNDGVGMPPADVLIVTALRMERDAVRAVTAGASGAWSRAPLPGTGLHVERREFQTVDGHALHVALICTEEMGGEVTAAVAAPAILALRPHCMAMCGVAAGHPTDTEFGDVVIADRLLLHDSGKRKDGRFEHEPRTKELPLAWRTKARDFAEAPGDALAWLERPAWTDVQQRAWLLDQLARGVDPRTRKAYVDECCPSYSEQIAALWNEGLVARGSFALTDAGKAHVAEQQLLTLGWPSLDPPRRSVGVHVAPMAAGNAVQASPTLWDELALIERKTLAVEMESHGIAVVRELFEVPVALVMKGVMDHADKNKDDRFKHFAARASAECLLAFVRRHVPTQVRAGYDDVLSPGTATPPANPAPSQLLDARHEVVPWHERGRTEVLAELDAWADDSREVSARLVHAEGGVGKTRLAIEWVRRRRGRHDVAGFLARNPEPGWFERLCGLGGNVLVVIDYAESRTDLGELLERVAAYRAQHGVKRRVRLLLLARNDGAWWSELHRRSTEMQTWLDEIPPHELGPVAVREADREEVFREAAQVFAAVLGRAVVHRAPIAFDDARFERVLYLHMAALAAVEGERFAAGTLMDVTLTHEERFWTRRGRGGADGLDVAVDVPLARQVVAAATLRGGLRDEGDTRAVLKRLNENEVGREEKRLLALLHQVYERRGEPVYVPGLEPDLLGEGMVLRVASPPEGSGSPAGEAWIERVFVEGDEASPLRAGFTVLGRASAYASAAASPWIARMLSSEFDARAVAALEAAKVVGRRTAFSELGDKLADALDARGDAGLARALERAGVPERTVSLTRVAEWVDRVRRAELPASDDDDALAERARLANNHGVRLSNAGSHEEALEAARKAVGIYRKLAGGNPDAFLPELAGSLNNLGEILSKRGHREEAHEATREAVEIRHVLAERDPNAFLPTLAMSLSNLSVKLGELGRNEEALKAVREAVEIRRVLADRNPNAFVPTLAMSLHNLGMMFCKLGRHEAALEAMREAVDVRRSHARHNPDAFLPDLAMSLNNLSVVLRYLGRHEAALEATSEAGESYRTLANRNPGEFLPNLAGSLKNRGVMLSSLDRHEEALEATSEAVEIYRALVARNPAMFLADLAGSLNNLGLLSSNLGHREEALGHVMDAIDTISPDFERLPSAFADDTEIMLRHARVFHTALNRELPPTLRERIATFERLTGRTLNPP